ncbi:hypothetical protein E3N88_22890 [Mikania micrantha]|uniref:Integrase catalytic domain-containing protein n=1 Tax=Mikania micrantha TaxID=192012 RepID=A0A5N6NCS7_9ASTR|nr:hypothetical protein E3N88_22890 [Mikania micrantha]
MRLQGVQLAYSTTYHPQSDGQTEVLNRCLETYLRCMCMQTPNQWFKWLSLVEWWYNTTYHSSIKMSPFQALYGYPPPIHISYIPMDTYVAAVETLYRDREVMIQTLKENLMMARNRMKQYAYMNRSERNFEPGNWVYLKFRPFVHTTLKNNKDSKLAPKYFGPFLIIEKIGKVAYKMGLLSEAQIHPVFHVSLLKKAHGSCQSLDPLPSLPHFSLQPRAIIDRHLVGRERLTTAKTELVLAESYRDKLLSQAKNIQTRSTSSDDYVTCPSDKSKRGRSKERKASFSGIQVNHPANKPVGTSKKSTFVNQSSTFFNKDQHQQSLNNQTVCMMCGEKNHFAADCFYNPRSIMFSETQGRGRKKS